MSTRDTLARSTSQWVTITVCVVLAIVFWFMVTLNTQTSSTHLTIPFRVENVPEQIRLTAEIPTELEVEAEGKGIRLLYTLLSGSRDTLRVDFMKHRAQGWFVPGENLDELNKSYGGQLKLLEVWPDSISLAYEEEATRKVPVRIHGKVNLPESYRLMRPLRARPDSVTVIGPRSELNKLKDWPTAWFETEALTQRKSLTQPLDTLSPFRLKEKSVKLDILPALYTEDRLHLTVRMVNVPEGAQVRLTPPELDLRYLIPMDSFGVASMKQVQVTVDLREAAPGSPWLLPQLRGLPACAEVVAMDPPRIQYQIIRKR